MINSRLLSDLDMPARRVCRLHIAQCRSAGIELLVTSTYRDFEAQNALYAIGRTKDLNRRIVTKAKGGHSWHNFRCAWDVVPIIGGKPVWDDSKLWDQIVSIAKECAAEPGPDWDRPHFQFIPPRMTLTRAFALFNAKGTIFEI